ITDLPGNADNPSIDPTGTYIAFDADGSFNHTPGPGAARRQVFFKNLFTGELIQVTRAADGDSEHPSFSKNAAALTFESSATLSGKPSNGVSQIFAYERVKKTLTQITDGLAASQNPMANNDGSLISFESSADLLGTKADTGITQIFVFNRKNLDDGL